MRLLDDPDYQAVLRFFAVQAAEHFNRHGTVAPACVLAWLHPEAAQVVDVHQFPTAEVVQLLSTEAGKHKLANAIRQMLSGAEADMRAPHVVVQVMLSAVDDGEALLLLVHAVDTCHAVALPVPAQGPLTVPSSFDLSAARLDIAD